MKNEFTCGVVLLALALSFVAGRASVSQKAEAEHPVVEVNNNRVIVKRNIHAAGAIVPMHSHREGVVVYLSESREDVTLPDGSTHLSEHHAGQVVWAPARQHALHNLLDKPTEALEIELK